MISNNSLKLLLNNNKNHNIISSFSDNKLYKTCNNYHKKSIKKFENKKLKHGPDTTKINTLDVYWELGQHCDFKKKDNKIFSILYNGHR